MVPLCIKLKALMTILTDRKKSKKYKSLLKRERKIPTRMCGMLKKDISHTSNEL